MTMAHAAGPVVVETAAHRLPPESKVMAFLVFVVAVALVPHGSVWPYAVDALVLAAVAVAARVAPGFLVRRLVIEIPFILFVVALPFVTDGPRTELLGLRLSEDGLWLAWGVAAKATLAVLASGVLAATTPAPAILQGCERLRLPRALTAIAGFAIRYVQLVLEELRRVQLARTARGDDPRWLWQARTVAQSAGTLAVRCFERGERVHRAMLARGFTGALPDTGLAAAAPLPAWLVALAPALAAAAVLVAARGGA